MAPKALQASSLKLIHITVFTTTRYGKESTYGKTKLHNDNSYEDDVRGPIGSPRSPQSQGHGSSDHSFTLQAIMDLQKSNGQLTESVNSLKTSIESSNTKLNKIEDCVSGIEKKVYAAGVVIIIFLAFGGFLINKVADVYIQQMTSSPNQQQPAITTTQKTPQPPSK